MKANSYLGQHLRYAIPRLAATLLLMLLALASTSPAFCNAIHDAVRDGDLTKVRALLSANPVMVSWKDTTGATPLRWAAVNGHKEVAELLVAKAKADAKNNHA